MNLEEKDKNNMEKLKQNIESIMQEKKYDLLEDIAVNITEILKKLYFNDTLEFMKNVNLSDKERLLFYIKLSDCKNISPTIKYELIPLLVYWFIGDNKTSFLNLLDDDEFINEFTPWFKSEKFFDENVDNEVLDKILNIPKIKEEVLIDPCFYIGNNSYKLFNSMPKGCEASLAFYSQIRYKDFEGNLKYLYFKYFGNILNKKELLILIKEHIIELKRNDIFELGLVKMLPFYHFLNNILYNKIYFKYAMNMKKNSKLDFNTILKFFYKYDKAPFFEKICKANEAYRKDMIRKIEYLSLENCLIDFNQILDLDKISLEEIKRLPKEKNDNFVINIAGGPTGKNGMIFRDGYEREIRRIDYDGNVSIIDVTKKSHETAVKLAYPDIEFDTNCTMAIERAIEATKQLSAITFIIENEACYVVSNNHLSQEQVESLCKLDVIDKDKSKFGIITYDIVSDNTVIAYNGESLSFDKMMEYMKSLNVKSKAI